MPVTKPDLDGNGLSHPARFSPKILEAIDRMLMGGTLLDPFAGTGVVHELANGRRVVIGIELEPEWAALHPNTIIGDATFLPIRSRTIDAIATSPTYGNRFADHHNAKDGSLRRSYTHDLGRALHPRNTGAMHWKGPGIGEYCRLHIEAWDEAWRVLRRGGRFVLNCKDHYRTVDGVQKLQRVTQWHRRTLIAVGFKEIEVVKIPVGGMRSGENRQRVPYESVVLMRKP